MKALKIIGVIVGSLTILAGAGLLIAAFGIAQTLVTDQQILRHQDYAGPYPATVVSQTGSRSFRVDWTPPNGTAKRDVAYLFGATAPAAGERIDVWQSDDGSDSGLLVSREPHLRDLAGTLRLSGVLVGVAGLLLTVGCIVALATGRRRRLRAGNARPPGPPGPPAPRGPAGPQYPPRQQFPPQRPAPQQQYPPQQHPPQQQYPPQQYPPQQYPPQHRPPERF